MSTVLWNWHFEMIDHRGKPWGGAGGLVNGHSVHFPKKKCNICCFFCHFSLKITLLYCKSVQLWNNNKNILNTWHALPLPASYWLFCQEIKTVFLVSIFSQNITIFSRFFTSDRQTDTQKICDGESYSFSLTKVGKALLFHHKFKMGVQVYNTIIFWVV